MTPHTQKLSEETVKLLKKLASRPEVEILNSEALRVVRSVWPDAFHVSSPKPLKIGIHKDMEATNLIPSHLIRIALKFFTTLERYLEMIKPGAIRVGLDGKPAGKVKLREAVDAEVKLFNQENEDNNSTPPERHRIVVKQMRLLAVKKADQ